MTSYANLLKGSRVSAWNVEFLDYNLNVFAGVFQHEAFVTYANVFDELVLAFDFKGRSIDKADLSLWRYDPNPASVECCHWGDRDDEALPAPTEDGDRFQFVVAHHKRQECLHQGQGDVQVHVDAGCARPVHPTRGRRQFYLPIDKKSNDPSVAAFPFRRRSVSPRKRSSSGSVSPPKEALPDDDTGAIAPSWIQLDPARARIAAFHDLTLFRGYCCAITGLGRPWSGGAVRPGIQACHIVPQIHYNVYPLSMDDLSPAQRPHQQNDDEGGGGSYMSHSRLEEQWNITWSTDNGICLASHIRELYDSRLISINPRTLRIRAFAPYDIILPYHGATAHFRGGQRPSAKALEHHWKVTCIENMAAKFQDPVLPSPSVSRQDVAGFARPVREDEEREPVKRSQRGVGVADTVVRRGGPGGPQAAEGPMDSAGVTPGLTNGSLDDEDWDERGGDRYSGLEESQMKQLKRTSGVDGSDRKRFLSELDWELRHWVD